MNDTQRGNSVCDSDKQIEQNDSEMDGIVDEMSIETKKSDSSLGSYKYEDTHDLDSMTLYLEEAGKEPLLSKEEEQELGEIIFIAREAIEQLENKELNLDVDSRMTLEQQVDNGEKAKEKLFKANMRLVVSIARKFNNNQGMQLLDLIQEGNEGLLNAVETFDYTRGNKFSTYATTCIQNSIKRGIANEGSLIRVPEKKQADVNRVMRTFNQLSQELGYNPSPEDVAEEINMPVEEVQELIQIGNQSTLSLETPIGENEDASLGDMIPDENAFGSFDGISSVSLRGELNDRLDELLNPVELEIIKRRNGLMDGHRYSLTEVGKDLLLDPKKIREIEEYALSKIEKDKNIMDLLGA